ncbi:MAG: response regulator [Myxococcales bacterium]|nr:response regulator [Myxococcales bacterium]
MPAASASVLLAEDDPASAKLLEIILLNAGMEVVRVEDGEAALATLARRSFDVLVTDWMMPKMDGIELCRRVRAEVPEHPALIMLTALASPEARSHALGSGADDFLGKPAAPKAVVEAVRGAIARRLQPTPTSTHAPAPTVVRHVPFVSLGIAGSTGGPAVLGLLLPRLSLGDNVCAFVVQHGPAWMLEDLVKRLSDQCSVPVSLGRTGLVPSGNQIIVAPGDHHMVLDRTPLGIRLLSTAPENYVRPAADPLFRSLAACSGRFTLAVVLTGLGRDGGLGTVAIRDAGGSVLIQARSTCVAPHMPQTVVDLSLPHEEIPVDGLAPRISARVESLSRQLGKTPKHASAV